MLAGASLLAGCASSQWTRADFTPAQAKRDERACHALAERTVSLQPNGFYASPSEFYGQNFRPASRSGSARIGAMPSPMFDADPVHRMLDEDRISDDCMRAKGYTLKVPPVAPPRAPERDRQLQCDACPVT